MKNERLQRLEPYELKDSRTVLRREKMSNHLDLVVKRIFGNENNPRILISFLNAVLKPKNNITDVEIKNTDINPYITYAVEFFIFIAKQSATNSPINQ